MAFQIFVHVIGSVGVVVVVVVVVDSMLDKTASKASNSSLRTFLLFSIGSLLSLFGLESSLEDTTDPSPLFCPPILAASAASRSRCCCCNISCDGDRYCGLKYSQPPTSVTFFCRHQIVGLLFGCFL